MLDKENSNQFWMPTTTTLLRQQQQPPSLWELLHTAPKPNCTAIPIGVDETTNETITLQYFESKFSQASITKSRKIPKIVHLTSKSRCLSPTIYENVQRWEQTLGWSGDYSYVLHDDAAMYRLLYDVEWPEFPHLKLLLKHCTISGTAKADVWRALVLWQYGGIYSDIDNAPGGMFRNGTVITDDMDSYFLIEKAGVPSQYFFAASPKHPMMYLLVHHCLMRLATLIPNVGTQYTPWITGPGALKESFFEFLNFPNASTFLPLQPGHYTGLGNRTMTIDGGKRQSWKIIIRESVTGKTKRQAYTEMNMKHFDHSKKPDWKESCLNHMYYQLQTAQQQQGQDEINASA